MQPAPADTDRTDGRGTGIRFVDAMPRPLLIVFAAAALAGVGLMFWLLVMPPSPSGVPLAERRSPPRGSLSHDVLRAALFDVPTPLPAFTPNCPAVSGLVIEGGEPAQGRIGGVVKQLCPGAGPGVPAELQQAIRALGTARIRFALFSRTGDLSTADLANRRILLAVGLSRVNVDPKTIGPLLAHEGYHLSTGGRVTAGAEYHARVAELAACRLLFRPGDFPRGCVEARAMVQLGQERALEQLIRAGFPR